MQLAIKLCHIGAQISTLLSVLVPRAFAVCIEDRPDTPRLRGRDSLSQHLLRGESTSNTAVSGRNTSVQKYQNSSLGSKVRVRGRRNVITFTGHIFFSFCVDRQTHEQTPLKTTPFAQHRWRAVISLALLLRNCFA